MMGRQDWLCAFDDGLVGRLRQCTLCGQAPLAYFGMCEVATIVVAYVLCRGCYTQDPQLHHIEAMMAARYERE